MINATKMKELIRKFFAPPAFEDEEDARIASFLNLTIWGMGSALVLVSIIDAIAGVYITSIVMLFAIFPLGSSYMLIRRKRLEIASYALLTQLVILVTLIISFGQGVHDIGVIAYAIVLICASYLLDERGILIITTLMLAAIAFLVYASMQEMLPLDITPEKIRARPADFFILAIAIIISASVIRTLTSSMRDAYRQARKNHANTIIANQQLSAALDELKRSQEKTEQRARRVSALNEISRAIVSMQDINAILSMAYEWLASALKIDVFYVALYDEKRDLVSYPFMLDSNTRWEVDPHKLSHESSLYQVIISNTAYIKNRSEDELDEHTPTLGNVTRASASLMMAPLPIGEHSIGAISVQSYQFQAYQDDDLQLLTSAAYQIAIAIQNARLYDGLVKRAAQLASLNEIGRAVSMLTDQTRALNNIFRRVQQILDLDVFYIILYDAQYNKVSYPLMYDSGKFWNEPPSNLDPSTWTYATIESRNPMLLNRKEEDILADQQEIENLIGEKSRISASIIMTPMIVGEKVLGVVSAHSYKVNAYTDDHLSLLTGIGHHIAIAIENARLYEALQKELKERQRAEEEVRTLNAELEERVRNRTHELEAANQEMESFAYTVSHDLRAPLRGIHGFSRILMEDFSAVLSEEGVRYVERISNSASRMGALIDDLLRFSRLGRQALKLREVNLTELAQFVADELTSDPDQRPSQIIIDKLPSIEGDYSLLKQVFANLLSNALKYSSTREKPTIHIGQFERDGNTVIFIKDNGVGFDMAHSNKLFRVFHRLHGNDEFEGTGVGLAIVQRIIARHGGNVWADSEINEGATFYFTLGTPE